MSDSIDLCGLGWTPDRAAHFTQLYGAEGTAESLHPARVARQLRGRYELLTAVGAFDADVSGRLRYVAVDETELPAVGDWVAASLRPDEGCATIHELLPRTSALIRKAPADRSRDAQVLVANVDVVWIVTSMNRDFNPRRIERTLALVHEGGARGIVVLSKSDLSSSPDEFVERTAEVAPDVSVLVVSAALGTGMAALIETLEPGATVALIGSSGVGKSTLVNRIVGREVLATSEIRDDDDKGRHTTTHRELIQLPGSAVLIDTPGLRELAIWADDEGGIESAFPDLDALFSQCRFHDCRHETEPGCAVLEALESGELDPSRLESYRKLKREAARAARMRSAKGRHEDRKKRRAFAKQLRQRVDKRDRW